SSLRALVSRYADSIQVVRCDAASATCGSVETISVTDLPYDPPGTPIDHVVCDNRPLRHLANSPPDHSVGDTVYAGIVKESDAVEKVYGMEWETLYVDNPTDNVATALKGAVATWKSDARGVVLDHRTGTGGTSLGPQILWGFAVPKHPNDY